MIELQKQGSHNIELVSPTHFAVSILKSIRIASQLGLKIPIIYNMNGYDSVEVLKLYKDVIDIYLPDFKYGNNNNGRVYSKVSDYFDKAKLAVKEMYNQVGSELVYENGVVVRGLIVRHLILPNDLSETEEVFKFIAEELDRKIHISLITQYFRTNRSKKHILISRRIRYGEFMRAVELLDKYGLENGWIQEIESSEHYRPSFEISRNDPFNNRDLKLI